MICVCVCVGGYPDDDAAVEDNMEDGGLSTSWWTLGEEGAEDSGVAISSMSAYGPDGLAPFLLKALLKELRNCTEEKHETEVNDTFCIKTEITCKSSKCSCRAASIR